MSFEEIRNYINDARTFYVENLQDIASEDMEDRLRLLITQDVNDTFKIGMGFANMYYDDVLHPKYVYNLKQKISVNSNKYRDFIRLPKPLLSSSYGHYNLKECYPSYHDCMECWKYQSSCCSSGTNSMYGECYNSSCMRYIQKNMSNLTEGMNDKNKMDLLLIVKRFRMSDEEASSFRIDDGLVLVRE